MEKFGLFRYYVILKILYKVYNLLNITSNMSVFSQLR